MAARRNEIVNPQTGLRPCNKCKSEKPLSEYRGKTRRTSNKYEYDGYCRDCEKARQKAWKKKHKKWYNQPPSDKSRARGRLRYAVLTGKLIKPKTCSVCKSLTEACELHGHHKDYSKPLDVVWGCRSCHQDIHRRNHCG